MKIIKKWVAYIVLILLAFAHVEMVVAQSPSSSGDSISTGVAFPIPLAEDAPEGTLICAKKEGYGLCDISYESGLFAVVSSHPAAEFLSGAEATVQVLTTGTAIVRVSTANGPIKNGSLITTSTNPGIGQLADRGGYVIGTALESFESANTQEIGEIMVSINIHPTTTFTDVRSNLFEALRQGLAAPVVTPLAALRYIMAGFIIIATFLLTFIYFGRISRAGIESMARNPLATRKIQLTILLNLVLMMVIVFIGFGIAYLILVL